MGRGGLDEWTEPDVLVHLERVHTVVERLSGLAFLPKRGWLLSSRVSQRMGSLHMAKLGDYVQRVETDPKEQAALLEVLRIGQTGWFRHRQALERLVTWIRRVRHPRIWVAGCGTGEEVYSLAALLWRKAGPGFEITGTDISRKAIETARAAHYRLEEPLDGLLAQHVLRTDSGSFVLREHLRRRCRFQVHNLLDAPPSGPFDAVVCRNVLMYFSERASLKALRNILRALRPGGVLVTGPSEITRQASEVFHRIDLGGGVAAWCKEPGKGPEGPASM